MDIKIKKEKEKERKLDVPIIQNNKKLDEELAKTSIKKDYVQANEEDLSLTEKLITTKLDAESFETLDEIHTIDIVDDITEIERRQADNVNKHADTIKIGSNDDEDQIDDEKPKKEIKINLKVVYFLIFILFLFSSLFVGTKIYLTLTSQERFINNSLENSLAIDDVYVYGESVNLIDENKVENINLYNLETEEFKKIEAGANIDEKLHFSNVSQGEYYLFSNDNLITIENDPNVEFQTITRDGENKNIKFSKTDNNILKVDVSLATNKKVDILIDASQGGTDGFLASDYSTTEEELSLKYALSLKSNLQELGYTVELTREQNEVPGNCNYSDVYCPTGRVAMAYENNPKLYIQIGFNGYGGSGFEIIDSHLNSHTLSRLIKSSLQSVLTASSRVTEQIEEGIYTQTFENDSGNVVDYSYLIRETGGAIMNSDNKEAEQFNKNKVGAEAVVLNIGYISDPYDFYNFNDDEEVDKITKSIANAIDQYVKQY